MSLEQISDPYEANGGERKRIPRDLKPRAVEKVDKITPETLREQLAALEKEVAVLEKRRNSKVRPLSEKEKEDLDEKREQVIRLQGDLVEAERPKMEDPEEDAESLEDLKEKEEGDDAEDADDIT